MQTELMRVRLLDWLYDFRPENPAELARVVDFLPVEDRADQHQHGIWRGVVRDLASDGLVMDGSGMGFEGISAAITTLGRQDVEARRARRDDRTQRNPAIRDAVIRWVNASAPAPSIEPMLASYRFEGDLLTKAELDAALRYLKDKGLVTGITYADGALLQIVLTRSGVDCVEDFGGSVNDYLRQQAKGGTTVNFNAPVTGSNLAWANRDVTQTAHTTTGVAGDELAALISAIKQALPVLGLDDADNEGLRIQLDIVDEELTAAEPDAEVCHVDDATRRRQDRRRGDQLARLGTDGLRQGLDAESRCSAGLTCRAQRPVHDVR